MPQRDLTSHVRQTALPEAAWEKQLGRLPHERDIKARFSKGRCQAESWVTSHDTLRELSDPLFDIEGERILVGNWNGFHTLWFDDVSLWGLTAAAT